MPHKSSVKAKKINYEKYLAKNCMCSVCTFKLHGEAGLDEPFNQQGYVEFKQCLKPHRVHSWCFYQSQLFQRDSRCPYCRNYIEDVVVHDEILDDCGNTMSLSEFFSLYQLVTI